MTRLKQLLFAILSIGALCLSAAAQIQPGTGGGNLQQQTGVPYQLGGPLTFISSSPASGGFNVKGLRYWQIIWVPSGTVSSCSISLDSSSNQSTFTTGGILASGTIGSCATAGSYANSSATTPSNVGQITPTITGSGNVTVALFGYVNNPATSGGAGGPVTAPLDGSGYVQVNCEAGCNGSNASVGGTSTSVPGSGTYLAGNEAGTLVGLSLDGSGNLKVNPGTVPVTGTFFQTTQPVSLATAPTTPVTGTFFQTTQPVSFATAPTTPTQPSGFSSSPLTAQVNVTGTATALASNSTHQVCVEALITNTIPVYVGASGETTSTGYALNAGDLFCWQVSNSNLLYLIASTTGASIQWSAL
jgi:hypothetical protein